MRISAREVNSKRHTVGYVVSGKSLTRSQVVNLARKGKIDNVEVHKYRTPRNGTRFYLKGKSKSLYSLPEVGQK